MKKIVFASAILFGGLIATAAGAMPATSIAQPAATSAPGVVQVDYACGRGFHVTPWGHCRPNGWGPQRAHWDDRRSRGDWDGPRHGWRGDDRRGWGHDRYYRRDRYDD
ncbi:GCG_CRPN prefix-to-repeats domain-containing protein [Rhizobium tubonense]|uniref:GCG_CRPN prefix-to-repeats domain-containing protein n=1 Tax=Rhizobium tubonense TaxID=484088 RepID=UPI0011B51535|nr:hypothetical protein [Rhizobium tubonense]